MDEGTTALHTCCTHVAHTRSCQRCAHPRPVTCFILSFSSSARRRASSFLCKRGHRAERETQRHGTPLGCHHPPGTALQIWGGSGSRGDPPVPCRRPPHLEVPPAVHVDVHQRPELDERVPHAPVPLPAGGHRCRPVPPAGSPPTHPGVPQAPTWPGSRAPGSAAGRSCGAASGSAA